MGILPLIWALILLLSPQLDSLWGQDQNLDSLYAEIAEGYNKRLPKHQAYLTLFDYCTTPDYDCYWLHYENIIKQSDPELGIIFLGFVGSRLSRLLHAEEAYRILHYTNREAKKYDVVRQIQTLNHLSVYHRYNGQQLDSSIYYLFEAIRVTDDPNHYDLWKVYISLFENYGDLNQLEKANEYLLKGLALARQQPQIRATYGMVIFEALNFSLTHNLTDQYQDILAEYLSFQHQQPAKSTDKVHDMLLFLIQDAEETIPKLKTAIDAEAETDRSLDVMSMNRRMLAEALIRTKRFTEAEIYLRQAEALLTDQEMALDRIYIYQVMAQLGRKTNNLSLELEGIKAANKIQDSLDLASFQTAISGWEVKYETEKKEAQLAQQELILVKTQNQRNGFVIGGLFLASLALGIFFFFRNQLRYQRREAAQQSLLQKQEIATLQANNQLTRLRGFIEGQEGERRRIAKDLHDSLGGLLMTVKAHIAQLPKQAHQEQQAAISLLDRASQDVRRIAHNMMPVTLSDGGISGSMQDIQRQLITQGLACELEMKEHPENYLDENRQIMILRIVEELTQNIVKHAQAKQVFIQFLALQDQLLLIIEDDGQGFSLTTPYQGGMGMQNITDRAAYLNAELNIDSAPGKGTSVSLSIPFATTDPPIEAQA